jgi:serine/threonine-protein kinase
MRRGGRCRTGCDQTAPSVSSESELAGPHVTLGFAGVWQALARFLEERFEERFALARAEGLRVVSETLPRTAEGAYTDEVTGVEPIMVGNKFRMARQLCVHDEELVYEALHTGTERRVRVHMLGRQESPKSPLVERMRRAARAAGRVPHPNVLGVVDSGLDAQGKPFVVYEFFGGLTLADLVANEGPLSMEQAARVTCQVLDALNALHRGGVVHRCVRPENVLVERNGQELRTKLTGFGLAVVQGKFDDAPALPRGFSRYLAPEARRNAHASSAELDLYAVGVLLRFLITGDAAASEGLDPRAERAIERACAEEPEERFSAAEHFSAAVGLLLPEAGGSEEGPVVDQLAADLRYMQQRRERDSGVMLQPNGESRMELYPVLMMIEAIYARLRAPGWKLLCDEVPEVERLLPAAGHGARYRADGVSAELVAQLLRVADALGGENDLAWLAEIGEALVKRGLGRFCPRLPAQLTPQGLVDCVAELWGSMSRHGDVVVLERSKGGARVAIRGQTAPSLEVCAVIAGLLQAQLRVLDERCSVSTIASQALGDAADIFVLSWPTSQ